MSDQTPPETEVSEEEKLKPVVPIWALVVSAAWALPWLIYALWPCDGCVAMPLNELGDFMAGVAAPLAFFWLVLGYFLQANELRAQIIETKRQSEAAHELASSSAAERLRAEIASEPVWELVRAERDIRRRDDVVIHATLRNRGGRVRGLSGHIRNRRGRFLEPHEMGWWPPEVDPKARLDPLPKVVGLDEILEIRLAVDKDATHREFILEVSAEDGIGRSHDLSILLDTTTSISPVSIQ